MVIVMIRVCAVILSRIGIRVIHMFSIIRGVSHLSYISGMSCISSVRSTGVIRRAY